MAQPTRSNTLPQPMRNGLGATIMGPRNAELERQNPNLLASPPTDAGTVPNLKDSFADAHNRLSSGGWAREVTARELPVSTTLAGVNMRLKPGAIRELHWHKEAEWAYMLAGHARITAIDADGHNFIDDLGTGDLWNFRAGLPHSIQALADGCEFLLVFDDGNFSENATFLLTDWFDHTPLEVLAKNLGVSESALSGIPKDPAHERYIFSGKVPPQLAEDVVRSPAGKGPMGMTYRLLQQEPVEVPGGRVRIVDSSNFPAASTIAAALVELDQGALRELHWHPTNDEWQYYISGQGHFAMGHYVLRQYQEVIR
jgi:oxalate decarboxylase